MKTFKELSEQVRRLAAEYPHATYVSEGVLSSCSYTRGHVEEGPITPGCIFGQAALRLGWDIPESLDMSGISEVLDYWGLLDYTSEDEDILVETWSSAVQEAQDQGSEWLSAVGQADEIVEVAMEKIGERRSRNED